MDVPTFFLRFVDRSSFPRFSLKISSAIHWASFRDSLTLSMNFLSLSRKLWWFESFSYHRETREAEKKEKYFCVEEGKVRTKEKLVLIVFILYLKVIWQNFAWNYWNVEDKTKKNWKMEKFNVLWQRFCENFVN